MEHESDFSVERHDPTDNKIYEYDEFVTALAGYFQVTENEIRRLVKNALRCKEDGQWQIFFYNSQSDARDQLVIRRYRQRKETPMYLIGISQVNSMNMQTNTMEKQRTVCLLRQLHLEELDDTTHFTAGTNISGHELPGSGGSK